MPVLVLLVVGLCTFCIGVIVGSVFPARWVENDKYSRVLRAVVDIKVLCRREYEVLKHLSTAREVVEMANGVATWAVQQPWGAVLSGPVLALAMRRRGR